MMRDEPQFAIRFRFPSEIRDRLKALAIKNIRSMNAEIILAIEHWLGLHEQTAAKSRLAGPLPPPSSELNA